MDPLPDNLATPLAPEERVLQAHLGRRLDPHRGSARRSFEAMLAQPSASSAPPLKLVGTAPAAPRGGGLGRSRWVIGLVTAAAACVAFGVGAWLGQAPEGATGPVAKFSTDPQEAEPGAVEETGPGFGTLALDPGDRGRYTPLRQDEVWQARNLGTYVLDGQPVRAVEHQGWQTTQYQSPTGAQVSIEVPRHQVVLIDTPLQ